MRMAKGGQLRGRVTEEQLIGVLDQVRRAGLDGQELTFESGRGERARPRQGGGQEQWEDCGTSDCILVPRDPDSSPQFSRKNRAMDSDDDFDL